VIGIHADEATRVSLAPLNLDRLVPDYRHLALSVLG